MSLFKSQKDAGFFRLINDEFIERIYDVRIGYYKVATNESGTNIYGESVDKKYYKPIWVPAWVARDEYSFKSEEYGHDVDQSATFSFLLDTLIDLELVAEAGDIIEFNQQYYEIDSIAENKFIGDSNPHRQESGEKPGYNVSIVCQAHLHRKSIALIEEFRPGPNDTDYNLPKNI